MAFKPIFNTINLFDQIIRSKLPKYQQLEWEIYLTTSIKHKKEALSDTDRTPTAREICATTKLPKYLWIAVAGSGSQRIFEFLFDATDFEDGNLLLEVWTIDAEATAPIIEFSKELCHTMSDKSHPIKTNQVYGIFIKFSRMTAPQKLPSP